MLRWLDAYDPVLAQHWHDAEGPKPFTCSTLIGGKRTGKDNQTFGADATYWFRVTSLEPTVSAALQAQIAAPPEAVDLDGSAFKVIVRVRRVW